MTGGEGTGPDEEGDAREGGRRMPGFRSAADDGFLSPGDSALETDRLALEDDDSPLPWLQGDDEEEFEESGAGQTIAFVVLGLLAIALLAGGVWWVMRQSGEGTQLADGSTIEAPDTPYKTRPKDPGGKVFDGTGDTSFGISEGQKRPARLGVESPQPQPSVAAPDKDAASGAPPVEAPGVGVQVAAYSNRDQAEAGWARLSQQYEVLADRKHRVVQGQADIGTVYRLQALAPDLASARTLCRDLKAAGLNCQVKN
jgi:hypothetical protein